MAERRMLSKSLLMDNKFLTLSNDSKSLYLYLLMFADDDGIVKRSIMIDSVLNATNKNYTELEEKGLIIAISGNDEIRVITNWNGIETIREKLYSPTIYLNIRSQLYLRTDYSYTLNKNDPSVFSSADSWVTKGRPKNIKDFNPLIQQHLQEVQDKDGISTVPVQDKDGTCPSPDKNRIDKYSVDKSRTAQANSEQTKKENKFKYINSSSNGGMGEILLNDGSSTSSIENNATSDSENLDPECIQGGSKMATKRIQELTPLFDSLNQAFNVNLSVNDERLSVLFDDLLNQYKDNYIQDGITQLASTSTGQQTNSSVKALVVNHLSESIKQALPH